MPGTMRWLCEQYFASAKFQSLAASTRKVRRGILEEICQRAGNFRYAAMETPHVAKLRDETIRGRTGKGFFAIIIYLY